MHFPNLRFSLRTLLIVFALIACWLGYHLRVMNQRRATLAWINAHGGIYDFYELPVETTGTPPKPEWFLKKAAQISSFRSWLGDRPMSYIHLNPEGLWEDRQRIAALFPEASVVPERPNGFRRSTAE